jgi:cytochrome P450 family 4
MHGFTDSVIKTRREELLKKRSLEVTDENEEGKKKMAFLDILLQSTINGQPLTNMDIREEVDTFMFEGHDTTSSGIAFAIHLLAAHPKVQAKCYDEIIHVLGKDVTKPVTLRYFIIFNGLLVVQKLILFLVN